jgi:dual specificity MAP kinase phosphatase
MATIVVQQQPAYQHTTNNGSLSSLNINIPRSTTPVPNKHIAYCPPGPIPNNSQTITPPNSPPPRTLLPKVTSLLHPPNAYTKLLNSPPIYGIDAKTLSSALDHLASQPLPEPSNVFPWLHGLHPENHIQQAFFVARKKSLRRTPKCLRGITIIKAGGDLSRSRIKGSVAPDEILSLCDDTSKGFVDCDPREGFSVRNFHIQAAKMAQLSDIVIYGDDTTDHRIIKSVAERTSLVQRKWRKDMEASGQNVEPYHTYVLTTPFEDVEEQHPELVAIDSNGNATGRVIDFLQCERMEMCAMSQASQISQGVFQGPTPCPMVPGQESISYDILIEASDHAEIMSAEALDAKLAQAGDEPLCLTFPSSGSILPPSWSQTEVDGILTMCRWMHKVVHSGHPQPSTKSSVDEDGDIQMAELSPKPKTILLHCADGYTETSLLTIAYFVFAEGVPVHEAWLKLHCDKQRNFFAYPSDVALLTAIQGRLLSESPAGLQAKKVDITPPSWLAKHDGSLPSRVLPYMYLGNLTHANNPEMLKRIGIKRILSVGEPVSWSKKDLDAWGHENLMMVDRVQDNGIDPLTSEFDRCLEFIGNTVLVHSKSGTDSFAEKGRLENTATLVHCRVGVSRSATICIAEVMRSMGLSFPRA